MKKPVKIGKGKAIPLVIRLMTIGVLFYLYTLLHKHLDMSLFIVVGIAISPLLPAIWSAQKVVEIDPEKKILKKYIWVLGKKIGKSYPFKNINHVILEELDIRKEKIYISYILLDDKVKIGLTRSSDKQKLNSKLISVAKKLNTPIKEIP